MERYNELDSLRGLAALTVLGSHAIGAFPAVDKNAGSWISNLVTNSPFHIFWAGHEAVILFFILSGFVLFLPFSQKRTFSYLPYAIKRICRIYIPYLVAILFAICLQQLGHRDQVHELNAWFNGLWTTEITWVNIRDHLIFLGSYPKVIDNVTWSLVHEMRISLVFPLIAYMVLKLNWKRSLLIGIVVSLVGTLGYRASKTDYMLTIAYLLMFIVGALISKHRVEISEKYNELQEPTKFVALFGGILLYTYTWWGFYPHRIFHGLDDWLITIGGVIFIITAYSSKTASAFLVKRPVHFLGKISYSLYLYHLIVFIALVHLFNNVLPIGIIIVLVVVGTLMLSTVSYYLVEMPAIKMGKMMVNMVSRKKVTSQSVTVE